MKKIKNGFTLIELLAVVVILAILSLIAIPRVVDSIKTSKESLYKEQVNRIIEASNKIIQNREIELPAEYEGFYNPDDTEIDFSQLAENKSLDVKRIPVSVLKEKGYIKDKNIKNPIKTSDKMDSDVAIYYNYLYNQYDVVYCVSEDYYKYYYTEEDYNNRVSIVCSMEYEEAEIIDPVDPESPKPSIQISNRKSYTDRIILEYNLNNTDEFIIRYWKEDDASTIQTIQVDSSNAECNFKKCTIKGLKTTVDAGVSYNFELEAIKDSERTLVSTNKSTEKLPVANLSNTISSETCPRKKSITIHFLATHIAGTPNYFFKGAKYKDGTIQMNDGDKLYDLGVNSPELSNQIYTLTIQNRIETTDNVILADHYYEYIPKIKDQKTIKLYYSAESNTVIHTLTIDESTNRGAKDNTAEKLGVFKITLNHDNSTNNTIIYERNGVGFYSDQTEKTKITKVSIPTKTGYTFGGYYQNNKKIIDENGNLGSNTEFCADVTLTAKWTVIKPQLTLKMNGGNINGSGNDKNYTMTFGTKNNNTVPVPTRQYYTFRGWYTAPTGGTQVYDKNGRNIKATGYWSLAYSSGVWNATNNVVLYANWETNPVYTISFDANGGSGAPSPQTYKWQCGEYKKLSGVIPKKNGYTFKYWRLNAKNGQTAYFNAGADNYSKCYDSDATLIAQWAPKTNTLTLNLNGGKYNNSTNNIVHGMTYDSKNYNQVEIPSRTGFTFDGWYTQATGGAKVYDSTGKNVQANGYWSANYSSGVWKRETDTTLYAHWIYNTPNNITSRLGTGITENAQEYCEQGGSTGPVGWSEIFLPYGYTIELNISVARMSIASGGYCSTGLGSSTDTVTTNFYAAFGNITSNPNVDGRANPMDATLAASYEEKVIWPTTLVSRFTQDDSKKVTYQNSKKDEKFTYFWSFYCGPCVNSAIDVKITLKDESGNIVYQTSQ